ncbi:MAG: hypothetical protein JXK05_05710 [Campylobacterales bacterium]|nr:hypothetical protein [Campylobacterales bacterium]
MRFLIYCATALWAFGGCSGSGGGSSASGGDASSSVAVPSSASSALSSSSFSSAASSLSSALSSTASSSAQSSSLAAGVPPLYLFLFMHTEDHINHAYSERRYRELLPEVRALKEAYAQTGLIWTIEFQGSDAKTVAERNEEALADTLREAAAEGVIAFGYHARHDPTYANNPMQGITASDTFERKVDAMREWVSCEKEPTFGGALYDSNGTCKPGGVRAIMDHFGTPGLVTGLFLYSKAAIGEHDAGVHAIREHLSTRYLGFGFPDHGSAAQGGDAALEDLFTRLTPSPYTSGTLFWSENILRINDGDALNHISSLSLIDGSEAIRAQLDRLDRSRPLVINAHLGSKYTYTRNDLRPSTSPTIYAYDHPDAPELPETHRNSDEEIDRRFATEKEALQTLVVFAASEKQVRFVSAQELVDLVMSEEFKTVDAQELTTLAQAFKTHVDTHGVVPDFVGDGMHYYALRDLFSLLMRSSTENETLALLESYGPFNLATQSNAATIEASKLESIKTSHAQRFEAPKSWNVRAENIVLNRYDTLSAAQLLYAMAAHHLGARRAITIPAMQSLPETYALLQALDYEDAQATSWSLKPAVLMP